MTNFRAVVTSDALDETVGAAITEVDTALGSFTAAEDTDVAAAAFVVHGAVTVIYQILVPLASASRMWLTVMTVKGVTFAAAICVVTVTVDTEI